MNLNLPIANLSYEAVEDGYYVLGLRNNIYRNMNVINSSCYIEGVKRLDILTKKIDKDIYGIIDDEFIDSLSLNIIDNFSSVPVLGVLEDGVMRDIITNKVLSFKEHSRDNSEGLTYWMSRRISSNLVKRILMNLTKKDLDRYTKKINQIEEVQENKRNVILKLHK